MDSPPTRNLGPYDGTELIATVISFALWGGTCMQSFIYFFNYPQDKFSMKAFVLWLLAVDTVHQGLLVAGLYSSLVSNFCNYEFIYRPAREFIWQILCTSLVCMPVQGFFAYRIWRFSGHKIIVPILLAPAALFQLAGTIIFVILRSRNHNPHVFFTARSEGLLTAVNGITAIVDVAIATALVCLLRRRRGDALEESQHIIQKLVIKSMNTGMWTALLAFCTLIALVVDKRQSVYFAFYFPQCPLYSNTLLANLNARCSHLITPMPTHFTSGLHIGTVGALGSSEEAEGEHALSAFAVVLNRRASSLIEPLTNVYQGRALERKKSTNGMPSIWHDAQQEREAFHIGLTDLPQTT